MKAERGDNKKVLLDHYSAVFKQKKKNSNLFLQTQVKGLLFLALIKFNSQNKPTMTARGVRVFYKETETGETEPDHV